MAKKKKPYHWTHPVTNQLYARIDIRQPDGKYKTIRRKAKNSTHVEQLIVEIRDEFETRGEKFIEGETLTFEQLADWYQKKFIKEPIYSDDGTRLSGIRTFADQKRKISKLKEFFKYRLVKEIDESVLLEYKLHLEKKSLAAATINRHLEVLRAMFNKAVRQRWMKENPFDYGEKLIEKSREKKRDRVLTEQEENKLLKEAKKSETNVYYMILCLMDTGARPSEIYDASTVTGRHLKWKDFFDYDFNAVRLTSFKGRQKKTRIAPVSERLKFAMQTLWTKAKQSKDDYIFDQKSYKTTWKTIKIDLIYEDLSANTLISIEDLKKRSNKKLSKHERLFALTEELSPALSEKSKKFYTLRLRDLRRSYATKMTNAGVNDKSLQNILGHEKAQTTFDYTEIDMPGVLKSKALLDKIINLETEQ